MPLPVTVTYQVWSSASAMALASAQLFATRVEHAVATRGIARIAISGGSTPQATFKLLADPAHPFLATIPWDKLQLFWVDERCVPPSSPESNYGVCRDLLLSKVPLPTNNIFRMEGELDPEEAASRYESTLRNVMKLEGAESPAFDLVVLGMGPDGHTASLFPHTGALNELGRLVVANHVPQKDTWRITLTAPVINHGTEVAFQVDGSSKSDILAEVLTGPRDPERLPSQLIRPANGKLLFLLDADAAAKLPPAATLAETADHRIGTLEI
ncbi:MAG TPA: 6-phosphogluconolactonase [Acidobacteriaceae bacterium]|jgi:6-phosphogluconolactonase|nr:6-phosphogluconolactonase [Acidobacteriaceae bacterium]